jgi:hypothetical protein
VSGATFAALAMSAALVHATNALARAADALASLTLARASNALARTSTSTFDFTVCHYSITKEKIMNFCRRTIYYAREEQKSLNATRNLSSQTSVIDKYMDISG